MNDEPKVNIDEFIQCLKREVSRLPVDNLELCDLIRYELSMVCRRYGLLMSLMALLSEVELYEVTY